MCSIRSQQRGNTCVVLQPCPLYHCPLLLTPSLVKGIQGRRKGSNRYRNCQSKTQRENDDIVRYSQEAYQRSRSACTTSCACQETLSLLDVDHRLIAWLLFPLSPRTLHIITKGWTGGYRGPLVQHTIRPHVL